MQIIIVFSLGTFFFFSAIFNAKAIECPLVQDILRVMECKTLGQNLYSCHYKHGNWAGEFQSQVDITKAAGMNQLEGRYRGNACTYTYKNPAVQVKYDIIHNK